ncbi:MAG: HlyD family efflux transporter periplasmic adaptor subunit [Thiohalomonadaceae bacterium]
MHWRRNIVLGLIGLGLIILIGLGFRQPPRAVDLATVHTGPLQVTVQEVGKTRVIDRYVISAPVAGYMPRITQRVGDSVTRGETIVQLEPVRPAALDARSHAAAQARIAAAQAALQAATEQARAAAADATQAAAEYQRLQELSKQNLISPNDVERARARAAAAAATERSSRFAVEVSRHELETARTALHYAGGESISGARVAITTPVAGRVLKLYQQSEGVVAAGQPLIEVGDPQRLEIAIEALSSNAVRIQPGMRVLFERWGGTPLEGRVRLIEPVGYTKISALGVEEQRVLVIADIAAPPQQWQTLGDGYRVDARFILWEGDSVLQVPASALFRRNDGWAVFVAENGRARLRDVKPGQRSGLAVQILHGLKEGESVIIHPDETVGDGVRIAER